LTHRKVNKPGRTRLNLVAQIGFELCDRYRAPGATVEIDGAHGEGGGQLVRLADPCNASAGHGQIE
jgi:hypothetical protein